MNQGVDLAREWRVYAIRRTLALLLLYAFLPFCFAAFYLSRQYVHQPVLSVSLMALWGAGMCTTIWWSGEYRCPRCRRRYGALGWHKGLGRIWCGLFDSTCSNCKLRKFEQS